MNELYNQIKETGIIPVVVLDDAKDALPLAKALTEGGLPVQRSPSAQRPLPNPSVS